jgi:hypothetical protein
VRLTQKGHEGARPQAENLNMKKTTPPTDDAYYVSAADVADKIIERLLKLTRNKPVRQPVS